MESREFGVRETSFDLDLEPHPPDHGLARCGDCNPAMGGNLRRRVAIIDGGNDHPTF